MSKTTVASTFGKSDNILSVSIHSSSFTKEGQMIGKVTRNTVTLENMIADIIEENHGLDPYVVQHAAILLKQQMCKNLKAGKALNLFDLGILYIGLKGCVEGKGPQNAVVPKFDIRFTAAPLAFECIKDLQVDKIVLSDNTPYISSLQNLWTYDNNLVIPGKSCRITGSRLKLGGDVYSLSFIPLDSDGLESKTIPPVNVELKRVTNNTPKVLEFFVPEELDPDTKYIIRITTSFLNSTESRKTPVSTDSDVITVQS